MARFMEYTTTGIAGEGPYYLDLDAIIVADFTEGRDHDSNGGLTDAYPQVVVFTAASGRESITIKDQAQIDIIRDFIKGRSHC